MAGYPAVGQSLAHVREQILIGLLRAGAFLGTLTLGVSAIPPLNDAPLPVFVIDTAILGLTWVLALTRRVGYRLRAALLLAGLYLLSCIELANYGFSQDASILFAFFSLLALLFFDLRVGAVALVLSLATLAPVGALISAEQFEPLAHPVAALSLATTITTCLIFAMVVGSVQVGVAVLFDHLEAVGQSEHQARALLEDERALLERRVDERTRELAQARDQALAAQQNEAEQREYLAALYQTTIDLLNRRDIGDLLQAIVERSTMVMDAPYGELMLAEGDELVVRAFTSNQPFLQGDRVRRDQALFSWQVYETREPAILADYSAWSNHRDIYASVQLRAVADFPILAGDSCVGVLALGRDEAEKPFTAGDIQKGVLLSQLAALVVENARLYDTALREIGERVKVEQALRQHALELQAQNAELDAFDRTVAHDLKSPVSIMVGYSEMLLELGQRLPQEQVRESLEAIARISRKMATIVDELLLLARVRTLDAVPLAELPMATIIAEADIRLRDTLAQARATISKPTGWPAAIGYAPWIEEVWVNYISNAIAYGGPEPTIVLGADMAEQGFVRFWVQDHGQGLSPEHQAQLFTPFTRLHTSRMPGHGLGLSIVQRIVTKLGGTVGVESAPGQGSRFYFTLPAADPASTPL